MFQGYVGFVLENHLRPECPIQDMDRLKPESLTLLLDELSICKSNWSLQQNEGTNLSKVRSEKKKSHLLRLCISLNCNKKCHFRENRYIGHTCAILFLQSHTTWAVVTYKSQKVTRPCCIHEHRNDSGQMKYSLNIDLHRPNTSLAPSPRQSLPDLPGV